MHKQELPVVEVQMEEQGESCVYYDSCSLN